MTEPTSPTPAHDDLDASGAPAAALGPDELEEMDNILDDLRARFGAPVEFLRANGLCGQLLFNGQG